MKKTMCLLAVSLFLALTAAPPAMAQGMPLPIQLKVTNAATNSISLSWALLLPSPVKGWEVHRGAGTAGFVLQATAAQSPLNYTDPTVQPGVVYSYKVRALLDRPGSTAYSDFSPVVQAVAIPGAPVLSCTERKAGTTTTQLSWSVVPGAAGYEVEQSVFRQGQFGPYEFLAETTTPGYLKSGMPDMIDYKFHVRAFVLLNGRKVYGEYSNYVVAKHVSTGGGGGVAKPS